tara:strand:- start:365 stop:547 length:183 start_codon:yes stop_codon:yes gene_type:complete
MEFNHLNTEGLYRSLIKTLNKNLELKSFIKNKIKETKGEEKLSWVKKYNTLFIIKWKYKE